jgi:hypothetical protein
MVRLGRDYLFCAPLFQISRHLSDLATYVSWERPISRMPRFWVEIDAPGTTPGLWLSLVHLLGTLVVVYFSLVQMRALGLLLRARLDEFGRFRDPGP